MKKLQILEGVKAINKKEQLTINGGHDPCFGTLLVGKTEEACNIQGLLWHDDGCWACFG